MPWARFSADAVLIDVFMQFPLSRQHFAPGYRDKLTCSHS